MARIVPGQQEQQDPGFAFLQGFQGARRMRMEEQQAQQALQLRQIQLMLQMQDAASQQAYQQAKTQEILNKQAQGGDLAAIQELSLRAQMPPEQKQAEQALGLLQNIKDPGMRKEASGYIEEIIKQQRQEQQYATADQEVQRAVEDKIIAPGAVQTYQQRLQMKRQSGESADDILTEFSQARVKRATDAANTEENMQALEEARTMLQSAPPGRNRKLAEVALKEYEMSPSKQREEGSGAKMLGAVQQALVGSVQEEREQQFRQQVAALPQQSQQQIEQQTWRRSMKSGEPSPLGVPDWAPEPQKILEGGKGWKGRPRDWPQGKGAPKEAEAEELDEQAMAQGIAETYANSRGNIQEVRKFVQAQGLDESDPNVQLWIRNVMEAMTSADRQ